MEEFVRMVLVVVVEKSMKCMLGVIEDERGMPGASVRPGMNLEEAGERGMPQGLAAVGILGRDGSFAGLSGDLVSASPSSSVSCKKKNLCWFEQL